MKFKNILPSAEELMQFRILDQNEASVLGGDVTAANAFFLNLEEILNTGCENKYVRKVTDLGLHESIHARFRSCGTTGVYKVLRVK